MIDFSHEEFETIVIEKVWKNERTHWLIKSSDELNKEKGKYKNRNTTKNSENA